MFAHLVLMLAAPTAQAKDVAHGYTGPEQVKMFESLRFVDGKGKLKGGSCEEAAKVAVTDLTETASKKNHPVVLRVYDERPRNGWVQDETVSCEEKGKKILVKIQGLALRPGSTEGFQEVSTDRVIEIVDSVIDQQMAVQLQLTTFDIEDYKGELYLRQLGLEREEPFARDANRNTRAVKVYRDQITPRIEAMASHIEGAQPEISGIHTSVKAQRYNKKGELEDEYYHLYVPTAAALGFANGDFTEQELINQGSFLYGDGGKKPVKMDISFIDAED